MDAFDPERTLENVLKRLQQYDPDGFFLKPVSESEAPGYSQIIKNPMCMEDMREKIRKREYRTWDQLLTDFKLMCNNAVTYNAKKSTVYKMALRMMSEGGQDLKELEWEGRKAIFLLHPEGPYQATLDEANDFILKGKPVPPHPFIPLPCLPRHGQLHPIPDEAEYSGFSDTESDDDKESISPEFIGRIINISERSAAWEPWPAKDMQVDFVSEEELYKSEEKFIELPMQWKILRRDIEWQCKWLELRMRELENVINSHQSIYSNSNKSSEAAALPEKEMSPSTSTLPYLFPEAICKHPFFGFHSGFLDFSEFGENSCVKKSTEEEEIDGIVEARTHALMDVLQLGINRTLGILHNRRRTCKSRLLPSISYRQQHKKTAHKKQKTKSFVSRAESKRLRRDFEYDDNEVYAGSHMHLITGVDLEKQTNTSIATPMIKEVSEEDRKNWQLAINSWRPILISGKKTMTDEVLKVLGKAEGESTEEEISDSNYIKLHENMENKEHERNLNVFGSPKNFENAEGNSSHANERGFIKRRHYTKEYLKSSGEDEEEVEEDEEENEEEDERELCFDNKKDPNDLCVSHKEQQLCSAAMSPVTPSKQQLTSHGSKDQNLDQNVGCDNSGAVSETNSRHSGLF